MYFNIPPPIFRVYKSLSLLALFIVLSSQLIGNNLRSAVVSDFSIIDGLSGNAITAVYQDSHGYIWVGTHDGLNRFDGYVYDTFRHQQNNPKTISGNYIRCIDEDVEGNIWIGTLNDGLSKWNRKTGNFTTYSSKSETTNYIPENNVYGISFDIDSTLWMKTDNYLISLNPTTKKLDTYGLYSNIFNSNEKNIAPIIHTTPNLLWVGTKRGISQFNKVEKLYERIKSNSSSSYLSDIGGVTAICKLGNNSTLIATNKGFYHSLKDNNDEFTKYSIDLPVGPESTINSITQLYNGEIWLGTKVGLRLLSLNKETNRYFFDVKNTFNKKNGILTKHEVTCAISDKSGLLWVGTAYNGLLKIDFKPRKFDQISKSTKNIMRLPSYDIKSIYVDKEGLFWLGTGGKGLNILDVKNNSVDKNILNRELYGLNQDIILSVCEDSNNQVWLGTEDGIYIYNKSLEKVEEFSYASSKEGISLLKNNQVNTIIEDSKGNIWFGTQFGLYKYDGEKIYSFFSDKDKNSCLCSDEIISLYQDSNNNLWIGTNEGVNYIDLSSSNNNICFKKPSTSDNSKCKLSNTFILSICEDDNSNMWFGTRSGLIRYSLFQNTYHHYSEGDGLANDMIHSIVCDKENDVWVSTNKGVSRVSTNGEIFNFDITDGLPGYVFNTGACCSDKDGKIYFGCVDGIAILNPDSVSFNSNKPVVKISSIRVFHKGRKIDHIKYVEDEISIRYRSGAILSVNLAALEFSEPSKNMFQVYLEGFDDDWRPISTESHVNISNIPPGNYTFWVKGSNNDQVWNEETVKLKIKVIPPIWQSSYAYAFYLLALVFLFQMGINFRLRRYKRANRVLVDKNLAKENVEAQKEFLSSINQNLTDSIHYAKRIQESILPSDNRMKVLLNESFVYFRPKDLVSGDFYWVHEEGPLTYVAAIDCTGHGVPGAFLSIIANNMLKNIVNAEKGICPSKVLDKLNHEVNNTFKKDENNVTDGMDIALCVINKVERKMFFAGAMNPLYLIRDNEIIVYKGNRLAIGHPANDKDVYTRHDIALEPNDMIYMFSDGYVDQFGGDDGKKFKYRRFRHLLLNIYNLPAQEQKAILHQRLEEWIGDFEQVDDIVVLGIRPLA